MITKAQLAIMGSVPRRGRLWRPFQELNDIFPSFFSSLPAVSLTGSGRVLEEGQDEGTRKRPSLDSLPDHLWRETDGYKELVLFDNAIIKHFNLTTRASTAPRPRGGDALHYLLSTL
jgi:hypothetical protein